MNKRFLSLIAIFIAVAGFLLVQATGAGTSEVILPSKLLTLANNGKDLQRIRVAGRVATAEIKYQVQPSIELEFQLQDPGPKNEAAPAPSLGQIIPVRYAGIKPDMFAAGRDVIIDGDYVGGVLVASKLLTQCPSKYEPPAVDKMYPNPK